MKDRSAVDTIRGYFYQFDLSILSILRLINPDDSIEIECTEDIDIRTATELTATQCKYYAKTEYNHSVIKEAVMYMLSHFKEVKGGLKPKVKYAIRGHYASGQHKLDGGIDVKFLKDNFLTYTDKGKKHLHHDELNLNDTDLGEFLTLLTVDIQAEELDVQYRAVIRELETAFNCKEFSAEFYFYSNALAIIRELSIQPAPADRTITKKAFLKKLDTSGVLFNEWFVQRKGKKAYLAALRKEYFTELNISPFERFFLIETKPQMYMRDDLKELIHILSEKWSKLSKRDPAPFCPYIYIHGISDDELLALKKDLHVEEFKFIDGHDYQNADFNVHSIMQKASHDNGVRAKILNSIRNLEETLSAITKTRKVFQFHFGQSYFESTNPSVGFVKIQVELFSDIKAII
ncbi:DUF4297 family anti-phage-associated protein [Iodobacter fluviatilis]|uniref:Uncharacterized protein n=1 Tax=Iodobacter fluviatilis TaxID=537 RepID=A0A377SUZ8_9NEIS|nr:DUF4297 family anti-phage-associated protein [Iodobacter fluviatilis]TCU81293.1 hypothetical protein EV682_1234 [Iodobacter fluviatilis]STR45148.1 Uncharacterised protein [Iodobacter fluviatilis]